MPTVRVVERSTGNRSNSHGPLKRWLFEGLHETQAPEGPHEPEGRHHEHRWWQVMCLTGVDYFSTLGYQPGIAFLAAGALSPVATLVLVLLTLFGALPIYRRVAEESPHGEGSISMLERQLPRWKGKLFVLALLGFVATDFIITITLSAADATAHILENPYTPHFLEHRVGVTIALIAMLGAVFLKGFKEAIGIAVLLVIAYLLLNLVIVGRGLYEMVLHPEVLPRWKDALLSAPGVNGSPLMAVAFALLLFPKLALGLSGFETGVAVMPLVKGDAGDETKRLAGRVRNTRKLLLTAALIMSVMLITSSFVTATLIPAEEFRGPAPGESVGGKAYGRALAFLGYEFFGNGFGTLYDLSTISILWFAGASALAGLLNIVPRYLPRYGMAPDLGAGQPSARADLHHGRGRGDGHLRGRRRGAGRRLRDGRARPDEFGGDSRHALRVAEGEAVGAFPHHLARLPLHDRRRTSTSARRASRSPRSSSWPSSPPPSCRGSGARPSCAWKGSSWMRRRGGSSTR